MSKKYKNDEIESRDNEEKTNTEFASASCFSSEQEKKFKTKSNFLSNTINKVTTGFPKILLPPNVPVDLNKSKWADLIVRTKWTIYMLLGFIIVILLGNFYCALLVLCVIMAIYKELLDLTKYKDRNTEVKNYYVVSWYFFFLCIYYFYIKLLMDKLNYLNVYSPINYILKYHNLISFMLYLVGFILFINSLTKGYFRYQFRTFAFIHVVLFFFGLSSSMILANIFNGLVWYNKLLIFRFILPAMLVICNDISAYLFGRMFGKTPLSSLSPKKTVEGFIGGFFSTLIFCYLFSELLLKFDFLLCPIKEITCRPFYKPECDNLDLRKDYILSYDLPIINTKVTLLLKQIHFFTFSLGVFASIFAPLGGLFASGFKRAIKIKDYGNLIPGHGGLTDRMDCQILMGFFTYIWTYQFLFGSEQRRMNSILKNIISLNYEDQMKIFIYMNNTLGFGTTSLK